MSDLRHLGQVYLNHRAVGKGIAAAVERGVRRSEIFVTTKLVPRFYSGAGPAEAVEQFLEELSLDYIDLVLLHHPQARYTRYTRYTRVTHATHATRATRVTHATSVTRATHVTSILSSSATRPPAACATASGSMRFASGTATSTPVPTRSYGPRGLGGAP